MSTETNTTCFTILNYTRYSTEDLVRLVQHIENAVPRAECDASGKPRMHSNVAQAAVDGERIVMVFRDFTGTPKYEYDYSGGQRKQKQRLFLARGRWKTPTHFRCLPPEKLHENPLAALSDGMAGQPQVPAVMVAELANRIINYFQAWGYRYGKTEIAKPDISGLTVRIESKRAANAPKRTKKAVALERITGAYTDANYRVSQVRRSIEGLDAASGRMINAARTLDISTGLGAQMLVLTRALDQVKYELERLGTEGQNFREV